MNGPDWPGGGALRPMRLVSVMSGTSLDGMDAVVVRFEPGTDGLRWEVEDRASEPYPEELRQRLRAALAEGAGDVRELTQLHAEIGEAYAAVCAPLCEAHAVDLVALSGQNVYHVPRPDPARGWRTVATLQLGEAARVLERCRVPVACDFRQSDMAAGGQGAPMVAFGDLVLFSRPGVARAVHNLGGISNLTYLPADGDPRGVIAFDTGPASCMIDEAAERALGLPFDRDGRGAAAGRVDEAVLERLMGHPYLDLPFPKTTGREVFALERVFADAGIDPVSLAPHDLLATLTAFTVRTIVAAYRRVREHRPLDEVLLAGGGAANATLVAWLRRALELPVRTFEELGMRSRDREALAFAAMAYYGFHGRASTLPFATGAARAVVAGKYLWPGPTVASGSSS